MPRMILLLWRVLTVSVDVSSLARPRARRATTAASTLLALMLSACGSADVPPAPSDQVTGVRAKRDASIAKKPDAGGAESNDGDDEAADDGDTMANAEATADTGARPIKDAGATDDSAPRTDSGAAAGDAESCATLTYESFGKAFVATYCTECHNSTTSKPLGGIALDTLPLVVKNKMYLKRVVIPRTDGQDPPMPKGGNDALTDAERTRFGAWIDCGPM